MPFPVGVDTNREQTTFESFLIIFSYSLPAPCWSPDQQAPLVRTPTESRNYILLVFHLPSLNQKAKTTPLPIEVKVIAHHIPDTPRFSLIANR